MTPFTTEFDEYHFPDELKELPQWVVSDASKIPLWQPGFQKPLEKASVANPQTWMSFELALSICEATSGLLPGFVLTDTDPYTVLDIDVKEDTPPECLDWYGQIVNRAGSYTELSASGKGVHVWLRANEGEGRRSSQFSLERYSQERFIVCTGNVHINAPISDGNGILDYLKPFLDAKARIVTTVPDQPQQKSDEEVLEDIADWDNHELFTGLMVLPLADLSAAYGYPSGSEADGALINFLCKASPNNAQVMRIFRTSALANRGPKPGQKDKIMVDDKYLLRTINNMRAYMHAEEEARKAEMDAMVEQMKRNVAVMNEQLAKEAAAQAQQQIALDQKQYDVEAKGYDFPHGIVGEIARWVYMTSIYPLKSSAILTALAFSTALTSKRYAVEGNHLNAYYVFAGKSGIGKDTIKRSLRALRDLINKEQDMPREFITAAKIRSGAALMKHAREAGRCLYYLSECGSMLNSLKNKTDKNNTDMSDFWLTAYSDATVNARPEDLLYSNKETSETSETLAYVGAMTPSFAGETTPDQLLEAMSDTQASSGFMSRLNIEICDDYRGERNKNGRDIAVPDHLYQRLRVIGRECADLNAPTIEIPFTTEARAAFDRICDFVDEKLGPQGKIEDDTIRALYNRIAEKTLRMTGTLAAMNNPHNPVITLEDLLWCESYVMTQTKALLSKHESGQIGEVSADKTRKAIVKAIILYLNTDVSNRPQEHMWDASRKANIINLGVIARRCTAQLQRLEKATKEKPSQALERTFNEMVREGLLNVVTPHERKALQEMKTITSTCRATLWVVNDVNALTLSVKSVE